jgi:hypothetical protein
LPAAKALEFLHGIPPNDFLTVAGDVETLSGSIHRGLTQGGDASGYVQLPLAGRGHWFGIKAS